MRSSIRSRVSRPPSGSTTGLSSRPATQSSIAVRALAAVWPHWQAPARQFSIAASRLRCRPANRYSLFTTGLAQIEAGASASRTKRPPGRGTRGRTAMPPTSRGRLHDERDVGVSDPAGAAPRPLRVQRSQPPLVERVDHITHRVHIGDQPGDRRHRRPRRRRHHDHRPADPDQPVLATPHDLLQAAPLLRGQPSRTHTLAHHYSWGKTGTRPREPGSLHP